MNKTIIRMLFPILIATASHPLLAADFKLFAVDYSKLKKNQNIVCLDTVDVESRKIITHLQMYKSDLAVSSAGDLLRKNKKCPLVYELYSWVLFRNGKWEEALAEIDTSLRYFGPHDNLVYRKAIMLLEMSRLGPNERVVDGNSVYKLYYDEKYDEDQYKTACLNEAMVQYAYLIEDGASDPDILYGYAQMLFVKKDYAKSIEIVSKLAMTNNELEYKFLLVDNLVYLGRIKEAEQLLLTMEKTNKIKEVYQRLFSLYQFIKNEEKEKYWQKRYKFSEWVPSFVNLEYSDENFRKLEVFNTGEEQGEGDDGRTIGDKLKLVDELTASYSEENFNILIAVLYGHANCANGVEVKIYNRLTSYKEKSVPHLEKLLDCRDQSTCTMTGAAYALSEIRNGSSFPHIVRALDVLDILPSTVIPPDIPGALIKFDPEKGLDIILAKLMNKDLNNRYTYISAICKLDIKLLKSSGKKYFSDAELEKLIKELDEYKSYKFDAE